MDIQYSYAGAEGGGKTDAKAIVVATTGMSAAERSYYDGLQRKGVVIASTFPSGDQVASPTPLRDSFPIVAVKRMNPFGCAVVVMLT